MACAARVQPDALFVIVPALALPTKLAAAAYIVTFVIGTVAAMGGYAAVIGAGAFYGPHEGLLRNHTQTCICEMIRVRQLCNHRDTRELDVWP